jgi:hypothetical protein
MVKSNNPLIIMKIIKMAQPPKETKLLTVAKQGSLLVSFISTYPSGTTERANVAEGLMSIVAVTSSLLLTLNSTLEQYFPSATPYQPFIAPLCKEISNALEELQGKVDEAKEKTAAMCEEKRTEWEGLLIGVGELGKRLEKGKRKVQVLIEGARLKGLHELGQA